MYIYIYICIYIYVYIQIYKYINIYTYMYIQIHIQIGVHESMSHNGERVTGRVARGSSAYKRYVDICIYACNIFVHIYIYIWWLSKQCLLEVYGHIYLCL
jgi:hypothetical protein